ncbi:unnamed protein product [Eretmochelys imbricata]
MCANEGYCDWKNLSQSTSIHSSSQEHIKNEVSLKRLEQASTPIDVLLSEQRHLAILEHNKKVRKNREILKRLIDISVLSLQELAFHCNCEMEQSLNQGNYRELFGYFFFVMTRD